MSREMMDRAAAAVRRIAATELEGVEWAAHVEPDPWDGVACVRVWARHRTRKAQFRLREPAVHNGDVEAVASRALRAMKRSLTEP